MHARALWSDDFGPVALQTRHRDSILRYSADALQAANRSSILAARGGAFGLAGPPPAVLPSTAPSPFALSLLTASIPGGGLSPTVCIAAASA